MMQICSLLSRKHGQRVVQAVLVRNDTKCVRKLSWFSQHVSTGKKSETSITSTNNINSINQSKNQVKTSQIVEEVEEYDDEEDVDMEYDGEGSIRKLGASRNDIARYKFVDRVTIEVHGGKGGNGCISHEVPTPSKKITTGGNGGRGGNVYIVADSSLVSLNFQQFHFNGGDGKHGKGDGMTGRHGEDVFIPVPLGTLVTEKLPEYMTEEPEDDGYLDGLEGIENLRDNEEMGSNEVQKEEQVHKTQGVFEINRPDDILQVAEGGQPGIGNKAMKGTITSKKRSTPATNIPGQPGQKRTIQLELKLIADVGLVGYPNAGKSSLLRTLSNARPKVAAYAFTTLHPSVGIVEYSDLERITVADIPGLIDGAHEGRGLGHDFLRHIERTKVLLYVIDAAGTDGRNPAEDLIHLIGELKKYNPELISKPALVFANKSDLDCNASQMRMFRRNAKKNKLAVLDGSTSDVSGIPNLATKLRELVTIADEQAKVEKEIQKSTISLNDVSLDHTHKDKKKLNKLKKRTGSSKRKRRMKRNNDENITINE